VKKKAEEQKLEHTPYTGDTTKISVTVKEEGEGEQIYNGDKVFVKYTGTLTSGVKFDSNIGDFEPLTWTVGKNQVIPCLN